jgi:hypothetical protein
MIRFIVISLLMYSFPGAIVQNDVVKISILQNYSTFRFIDFNGIKHHLGSAIKDGYGMSCNEIFEDLFCIEGTLTYNNTRLSSTFSLYDNIIK